MGNLDEFSWKVRLFLRAYRWRSLETIPWKPLGKGLSGSRLAIVSSAGFVAPGQEPFKDESRGGDYTYREIQNDIEVKALVNYHRSSTFDHSGIEQDANLAFPIDRLRELAEDRKIGSVNHRHFSFMGSITAPGRLVEKTAPEVAQKLVDDGVDGALLVPV